MYEWEKDAACVVAWLACTFDMEGVKRLTLKERKELHSGKLDTPSGSDSAAIFAKYRI